MNWKANDDFEWTYKRKEGDLVVYAPNKERAMETLKQHGFLYLDPINIKKTGGSLADYLEHGRKERG